MQKKSAQVKNNICTIILAAGLGTRMKSDKAKVLHNILGRPMITYVVEIASKISGDNVVLVVGHQAEIVRRVVSKEANVSYAFQEKQRGTGHAVMCALPHVPDTAEHVMLLSGDVPNLSIETALCLLKEHLAADRDLSILAVDIDNPTGYGRIIVDSKGRVTKIVEEADASAAQKQIKTINSGIYCVKKTFLCNALEKINADNAQNEYYLTDIIEIGCTESRHVGVMVGKNCNEVLGVNSVQDLAAAEKAMRSGRGKIAWTLDGVTHYIVPIINEVDDWKAK